MGWRLLSLAWMNLIAMILVVHHFRHVGRTAMPLFLALRLVRLSICIKIVCLLRPRWETKGVERSEALFWGHMKQNRFKYKVYIATLFCYIFFMNFCSLFYEYMIALRFVERALMLWLFAIVFITDSRQTLSCVLMMGSLYFIFCCFFCTFLTLSSGIVNVQIGGLYCINNLNDREIPPQSKSQMVA